MPNVPFDLNTVEDNGTSGDYGMVPEGEYEVKVTNTEGRTAKSGNEYLNVEFTIVGPTQANRKVWDNHFIYSDKNYPRVKFKNLVNACGLQSIKSTEELHGRTCVIKLAHSDCGKYENVEEYMVNTGGPSKPAESPAPTPIWAA